MGRCLTQECDKHDHARQCCKLDLMCSWGAFELMVRTHLGEYGDWRIRQIGAYGDALVATLKGRDGRIEVWGGSIHRIEVWFIPRGTKANDGDLIAYDVSVRDGSLQEAVRQASLMAGIQRRLFA